MSVFMTLFTIFLYLYLSIDFIANPLYTYNNFYLSSRILLIIFIAINIFLYLKFNKIYPKIFVSLHKKLIFPILLLLTLILTFIENINHPNFVLIKLGVHIQSLIFITTLSGFIIFISKQFSAYKHKLIYVAGVLFVVFSILLNLGNEESISIFKEDGFFESLQVVFYFLSALISFRIAYLSKKINKYYPLLFIFLAIGFIFVGLEEMSWGQRLLNIETPDSIKYKNTQKELTVHNLDTVQPLVHSIYMTVGFYGSILPLLLKKYLPKVYKKVSLFFPKPVLFFYFFSVLAFYFIRDFFVYYPRFTTGQSYSVTRWQEVAETVLATGFLLYVLQSRKIVRNKIKS